MNQTKTLKKTNTVTLTIEQLGKLLYESWMDGAQNAPPLSMETQSHLKHLEERIRKVKAGYDPYPK